MTKVTTPLAYVFATLFIVQLAAVFTAREFYFSWSADEKVLQRNDHHIEFDRDVSRQDLAERW